MTVRGWCRAVRAGVFAVACVLLAVLGHMAMSGTAVPWWAVGVGLAGTGAAAWLLAGRERGRTPIVAVVTVTQAVLHETFSLAQGIARPSEAGSPAMPHDHAIDGMGGMHADPTGPMGASGAGGTAHTAHDMSDMGDPASVGMFAAHLVAAVLCGLWLAHGERAVFRILRAAASRLVAPLRLLLALPVPVPRTTVRRRRVAVCPALVSLPLSSSLTFRGPPVGVAVV